jgi:hypothetical protein
MSRCLTAGPALAGIHRVGFLVLGLVVGRAWIALGRRTRSRCGRERLTWALDLAPIW